MPEQKEKSIGALWKKESSKGTTFLSGELEIEGKKHRIVVFKNTYKEQEKHPDYRIFLSQPMKQEAKPVFEAMGIVEKDRTLDEIPF